MQKLIPLVLSLAMVFSLVACGGTPAPTEDVAILFTNDVHTYIDNPLSYDVIAAVKGELATQYKNVLLVDAGDHAQGTVYGSMDFGKIVIELMNGAGYDLTIGSGSFVDDFEQQLIGHKPGENVTVETLGKICAALNCGVDDIMEFIPNVDSEI